MARRPKQEEYENHERWLVSYADFITLLFAFFVVMYSISSVNEGKYRVLSSSLVSAFSDSAKSLEPIQYGTPLRTPIVQHQSMLDDEDAISRTGIDYEIMPNRKQLSEMQKITDEIERMLKKLIEEELVTVSKTNLGVEIEIKSSMLFSSGSANLAEKAKPALNKIAKILGKIDNDINVEGFTDNVPIHTLMYPSNWELSSARASSVVRLFVSSNIASKRLKVIGFGEFQPVADNNTVEGRNRNRRVTIFVLNSPDKKRIKILEKKNKNISVIKSPNTDVLNTITNAPNKVPIKQDKPKLISSERKPKIQPIRLLKPKLITIGNGAQ